MLRRASFVKECRFNGDPESATARSEVSHAGREATRCGAQAQRTPSRSFTCKALRVAVAASGPRDDASPPARMESARATRRVDAGGGVCRRGGGKRGSPPPPFRPKGTPPPPWCGGGGGGGGGAPA